MNGMYRFSEATSLAIHGMALLAMSGRRMRIKEMVEVIDVSGAHLAKVFQRLCREGFVTSFRGPNGGFELSRGSASITLYEIYVALEGKPVTRSCFLGAEKCPFSRCLFSDFPEKMSEEFLNYLKGSTLESVVLQRTEVERNGEAE